MVNSFFAGNAVNDSNNVLVTVAVGVSKSLVTLWNTQQVDSISTTNVVDSISYEVSRMLSRMGASKTNIINYCEFSTSGDLKKIMRNEKGRHVWLSTKKEMAGVPGYFLAYHELGEKSLEEAKRKLRSIGLELKQIDLETDAFIRITAL
jgi:hypothetical protein